MDLSRGQIRFKSSRETSDPRPIRRELEVFKESLIFAMDIDLKLGLSLSFGYIDLTRLPT